MYSRELAEPGASDSPEISRLQVEALRAIDECGPLRREQLAAIFGCDQRRMDKEINGLVELKALVADRFNPDLLRLGEIAELWIRDASKMVAHAIRAAYTYEAAKAAFCELERQRSGGLSV
jgi:hypothetical protein